MLVRLLLGNEGGGDLQPRRLPRLTYTFSLGGCHKTTEDIVASVIGVQFLPTSDRNNEHE
jgi:hypothetical protein